MTHTLCHHLVNTYCLKEYSKSLKHSEKQPEKKQLWCSFLFGKQKFSTGFLNKKVLFLQRHKTLNLYNKFKSRNVKHKSLRLKPPTCGKNSQSEKEKKGKLQALYFQSLNYRQPAFPLNQSSPLWGTLYFSRHSLAFLNLRSLCSSLLKALHVCLFAALNNRRILFVGDPRPLVKEHQHKYQHCFISSQVKSLSTPMANQLPPVFQYLQKKSNFQSFFQSLQQDPRAQRLAQKVNFSDPLKTKTKETDSKVEKPKALLSSSLAAFCKNKSQKVSQNKSFESNQSNHKNWGSPIRPGISLTDKNLKQRQLYIFSNLQGVVNLPKVSFLETKLQSNKSLWEDPVVSLDSQPIYASSAATKFKQSFSELLKKNLQLENNTLYSQNLKKHQTLQRDRTKTTEYDKTKTTEYDKVKTTEYDKIKTTEYDKVKTKLNAQINESDLFFMALTKLACKAAFRNSQWTAAFAQAEKGWKGGFFSNSLVSYKQNLTLSSKLNIQGVNGKNWLSLEIPFSSKLKLLYFSSKPETGAYGHPIYFPAAKKKMIRKVENMNKSQALQTKSQVRKNGLYFSGQIPVTKKLFKKFKLFGLRFFAYKKILTQVAKVEKAHLAYNPWLKEADLVFFANPEKSAALLSQVNRLRIPSIGIVNSGENLSFPYRSVKGSSLLASNPTITYPIIGNSNSLNFIKMVYAKLIGVLSKKVKFLSLKPKSTFAQKPKTFARSGRPFIMPEKFSAQVKAKPKPPLASKATKQGQQKGSPSKATQGKQQKGFVRQPKENSKKTPLARPGE